MNTSMIPYQTLKDGSRSCVDSKVPWSAIFRGRLCMYWQGKKVAFTDQKLIVFYSNVINSVTSCDNSFLVWWLKISYFEVGCLYIAILFQARPQKGTSIILCSGQFKV